MSALFEDSSITKKDAKTTIRGKIAYKAMEGVGNTVFNIVIYIVPALIIYYFPMHGQFSLYLKLILIPTAIFLSWLFLHKFVAERIQSVPLMTIDTNTHMLTSVQEKFATALSAIQNLSIVEESNEKGDKLYKIQCKLAEGDKTLEPAFLSYNAAEKVLNEIKNSAQ